MTHEMGGIPRRHKAWHGLTKFRHEGYKEGDFIRAYDFEKRAEIGDRYIEGEILTVDLEGTGLGFANYRVRVTKDTLFPETPRPEVYVPMECLLTEWDGRITKLFPISQAENDAIDYMLKERGHLLSEEQRWSLDGLRKRFIVLP